MLLHEHQINHIVIGIFQQLFNKLILRLRVIDLEYGYDEVGAEDASNENNGDEEDHSPWMKGPHWKVEGISPIIVDHHSNDLPIGVYEIVKAGWVLRVIEGVGAKKVTWGAQLIVATHLVEHNAGFLVVASESKEP